MASPKLDPAILAHLEWIGFVQPKGLVVSAPALVRAGAILIATASESEREVGVELALSVGGTGSIAA